MTYLGIRACIAVKAMPLIAVASALSGCATDPIQEISTEVEKIGFTVYNPPRADHGPGWVFHFVKTFDGKTVPSTVCQSLFPDELIADSKISLPNITKNDSADVNFGASLLEGLVDNVQKASANLTAKSIKKVNIKWGDLVIKELPEERRFDEQGKLLPISDQCAARLRELKKTNQLDSVFVVQQSVQAKSMTISVDLDKNAGAQLDVSLYKLLNLKPEAKVTSKTTSSIEVADARNIGFVAVAIIDWTSTNQFGNETANVSGKLLNSATVKKLMAE